MNPANVEQRIRRLLWLLAGSIFLVTPIELWFSEHLDETEQKIPFVLCALGVVMVATVWIAPSRETIWTLQGVMVLIILGSLLGMYYHLAGNFSFELEIRPNATRSDVVMDALKGANPLLAPGILAVGGCVSLIATYQHPVLQSGDASSV